MRCPSYPRRGLGGTFLDTGGMSTICLSLICAIVVVSEQCCHDPGTGSDPDPRSASTMTDPC